MSEPIVILPLDSRSWGPAYCDVCDHEVEEVLLTKFARFVCPDCGTEVLGFEQAADLFCSARVLTAVEIKEFQMKARPSSAGSSG